VNGLGAPPLSATSFCELARAGVLAHQERMKVDDDLGLAQLGHEVSGTMSESGSSCGIVDQERKRSRM